MRDPDSPPPTIEATATKTRSWIVPLATGLAGLVLGVGGSAIVFNAVGAAQEASEREAAAVNAQAIEDAKSTLFVDAVSACGASRAFAEVGDGGQSLTVDMKGKDDFAGLSFDDAWCIVNELDTPQSVQSVMRQTTAMDGRQTESFGDIEVSWSYHPDRGMDSVWSIAD